MCLYPKLILNRKYTVTKKNGGNVPYMHDPRLKYVAVGCGNCIECRKQKSNEWKTRLMEEMKHNEMQAYFVTLTFSEENLQKLMNEIKTKESNAVAGIAIRRYLERWRKKHKKSVKHWLITELGHEGTERIHLHGIIWTDKPAEDINNIWQYGYTYIGNECTPKTINYIVKYITKIDEKHKNFRGQIFCSSGLGAKYMETFNAQQNKYNGIETKEYYILKNGNKIGLPIYFRNKIYSEEEREKLWLQKLDKQERFVLGEKIDVSNDEGEKLYYDILKVAQEKNKRLGYGDESKEWRKEDYNITLRKLNTDGRRETATKKRASVCGHGARPRTLTRAGAQIHDTSNKKKNSIQQEESKDSAQQSVCACLPRSLRSQEGGGGQTHGAV